MLKKIALVSIFSWSFVGLAQTVKTLDNEVKRVNVYLNEAMVEREARFSSENGKVELVFEKLSPYLRENSIEVKVPKGVTILSVITKNNNTAKEEKPEEIVSLEDSLNKLNDELFLVKADKESISQQKQLLLSNKSIGGTSGVKADELEDILGVFNSKLNEYKIASLKLNQQEKHLSEQINKINLQLRDYQRGRMALNKKVIVQAMITEPQRESLVQLKYLVSRVSWVAQYDIRAGKVGTPIEFVLKANIQQTTGEDWTQVMLNLSGINLGEQGNLPVIYPEYVQVQEPVKVYKGKAKREERQGNQGYVGNGKPMAIEQDGSIEPMADAPAPQENSYGLNVEGAYATSQQYQTPTSVNFEVKTPYDIPSDGQKHLVELSRFQLQGVYKLITIPKYDESVYVTAFVQANDLLNQISANANIYYEGAFTGTTYISRQLNDTFTFTLGKERRINVQKTRVANMNSKSTFGSTKKETSTFEIKLVNTISESIEIEVRDNIPLSNHSDVTVKLLNAGGASQNAQSGELTWKLSLPPKQEVKATYEIEVSYPSNKIIYY